MQLRLDLDKGAAAATGDPARLQQVVWNLVSNAVKFTDRGGTVTVRLHRVESSVEIQVQDTGAGIDAQFLPHVFERFRQADVKSTRSAGGLGLGLSIVRELVELHGGTVTADSAGLKRGSCFKVILPVAAATAARPPRATEATAALDVPRLDGLSILVVDDDPDARVLLTEILHARGATVRTAASAAAIDSIQQLRPDVLLSDIGMANEDGYALIRRVRDLTRPAKFLPAAALTAYAGAEDRTRALMAGFQSHVVKPVDPSELIVVVAALAGRMS